MFILLDQVLSFPQRTRVWCLLIKCVTFDRTQFGIGRTDLFSLCSLTNRHYIFKQLCSFIELSIIQRAKQPYLQARWIKGLINLAIDISYRAQQTRLNDVSCRIGCPLRKTFFNWVVKGMAPILRTSTVGLDEYFVIVLRSALKNGLCSALLIRLFGIMTFPFTLMRHENTHKPIPMTSVSESQYCRLFLGVTNDFGASESFAINFRKSVLTSASLSKFNRQHQAVSISVICSKSVLSSVSESWCYQQFMRVCITVCLSESVLLFSFNE